MNHFVEVVTFKSRPDFTLDEVIAAAEGVNVFLKEQQGFISRTLGRARTAPGTTSSSGRARTT